MKSAALAGAFLVLVAGCGSTSNTASPTELCVEGPIERVEAAGLKARRLSPPLSEALLVIRFESDEAAEERVEFFGSGFGPLAYESAIAGPRLWLLEFEDQSALETAACWLARESNVEGWMIQDFARAEIDQEG